MSLGEQVQSEVKREREGKCLRVRFEGVSSIPLVQDERSRQGATGKGSGGVEGAARQPITISPAILFSLQSRSSRNHINNRKAPHFIQHMIRFT